MSTNDLRTVSSKALIGFAAILAVGFIVAAFIVSGTVKSVASSGESITVKGLAEKSVKATSANWSIGFSGQGQTAKEAYADLRQNKVKLIDFLKEQKFTDAQISSTVERASETYDERRDKDGNYERIFRGYIANQVVMISTDDVAQMNAAAQQAFRLDELNIKVNSGSPEYLVSNLEEIKMSLISDATKNAHVRASEFAKSGNAKVGSMKSASQGAFYILPAQGGVEDSDYGGVYDKSTIDKVARVVVTINYGIEP